MSLERHLTSEELDLLELGSLEGEARALAEAHLGSCPRCSLRRAELKADAAHFRQFVMPRTLDRATAAVPARRKGGLPRWAAALAGITTLAVAVLWGRPLLLTEEPYVGARGTPALKVVVARGEAHSELFAGSTVRAGDRLRFVTGRGTLPELYVLVLSRDPLGMWSVYAPFEGEWSLAVPPVEAPLPGAVELDATQGSESLVAVFSRAPLAAREVIEALRERPWPPEGKLEVSGALHVQLLSFEKR